LGYFLIFSSNLGIKTGPTELLLQLRGFGTVQNFQKDSTRRNIR
jgi:hypothetical protein